MQNSDGKISPRRPHFFKIILQHTLNQGKIGLPRSYVLKHRNDLLGSDTVLLKLPDGRQWPIGLAKSDGTIWLQDGWEEFAQHYHLKHGSFLVFLYDGSCHFKVIIFDLSTTEIDYPRPCNAGEGSNTKEAYQAEDVGDEVKKEEEEEEEDDDDDDDDDDVVSVEIIGESSRPCDVQNWMTENSGNTKKLSNNRCGEVEQVCEGQPSKSW